MPESTVIPNPVINSPFEEPRRHFKFGDDGITNEIVDTRRASSYFIPIAQPKKKGKQHQPTFSDWTADRIEENKTVNFVRQRVKLWREGGCPDVTRTTARLLEHWKNPERLRRLFFCRIEAMETFIYVAEAAKKYGDAIIENDLRAANEAANPDLLRIACKMATGSGKTVVMAMLIAWQTLNILANPRDARFTDAFLIVTPERRGPRLDQRAGSHPAKDGDQDGLRPVRHPVFSARVGLLRGHALPLGHFRFFAHRRDRVWHRRTAEKVSERSSKMPCGPKSTRRRGRSSMRRAAVHSTNRRPARSQSR